MENIISTLAVIVLTIILIVFIISILFWSGNIGNPLWQSNPRTQYKSLVSKLGYPTSMNYFSHGFARWSHHKLQRKNFPFREVLLKDEEIPHCCPTPHTDCLTVSLCVYIDHPTKLISVLSISEGVWYDQLEHLLYVRCNSLVNILSILLIATKMISMEVDKLLDYWRDTKTVQNDLQVLMKQNEDSLLATLKINLQSVNCTGPFKCSKPNCATLLDYNTVIGGGKSIFEGYSNNYATAEGEKLHPRMPCINTNCLNPEFKENANQCFMNNQPITPLKPTYDWK